MHVEDAGSRADGQRRRPWRRRTTSRRPPLGRCGSACYTGKGAPRAAVRCADDAKPGDDRVARTTGWIIAGLALGGIAVFFYQLQLPLLVTLALGVLLLRGQRPREAGTLSIAFGAPGIVLLSGIFVRSLFDANIAISDDIPEWLALSTAMIVLGAALVWRYRPARRVAARDKAPAVTP